MTLKNILLASAIVTVPAAGFANDWNGPYAGIAAGSAEIDTDDGAELDGDGNSLGIFAGYLFNLGGGLVSGIEVDYDETEYDIGDGAVEVDSTGRIKGRLGTELGSGLVYGTLGFVSATSPELGDDTGYLVGIGYDFPITENIDLGAELLNHEFEDYNNSGIDVGVTTLKARIAFNF
ncbi:outer membrane protein [Cognatiyoonia sp. IB215182]|uniref:outer membrane protein n=1 Tax=Cognatiyoonia sp. IB215182 TaxID=3097353 RepID=UPI002A1517E7|nr:outer membrane beta-barrel protein [Cognatiyoonia sp. IB215182]MDX8353009.1 outer membrane beta-barrel protein [Cognatiyoonia sp. IB215182]